MILDPLLKSVLAKYNVSLDQIITIGKKVERLPIYWIDFRQEAFYELDRDFELHYDKIKLKVGQNDIGWNSSIIVDKIITLRSGYCYQITFHLSQRSRSQFNGQSNDFIVEFGKTETEVLKQDIPEPKIHLTSEQNAYGIIDLNWGHNGKDLRFYLKNTISTFLLVRSMPQKNMTSSL